MRVLLLAIVTLIAYEANAQNYTRDCGFRLGDQFSAGYRQFLDDEQAIEGMFSVGRRGVRITLLKEHSWPALGHISENLFFKYGYGAHAGFRYIGFFAFSPAGIKAINRSESKIKIFVLCCLIFMNEAF